MPKLSRRHLLTGAAAVSVGAVAGAIGLSQVPSSELGRATLRRLAGPFLMADAEFDRFFSDFMTAAGAPGGLKAGVLRVAEAIPGGPRLLAKATGASESYEGFERALLTGFVTQTTFLQRETPTTPISYLGASGACSSPYARFEDV